VLRVRLARRGVAIGVLAVAAGLSTGATVVASQALLNSTIHLGAQTLSGSVSGTIDLSHLEPLIQLESTMFTSKLIVTSLLCATAVVGMLGMNRVPQTGDGGGDAVIGQSVASGCSGARSTASCK
jgi:hypothetical protein